MNKNLFLFGLSFLIIIGTFSVVPYVFADMTAEEIMEEELYDGQFIIKGTSTDGSVIVLVGTERPVPPNFWGMQVIFADAKSGAVIEHVNYDLLATQENSLLEDRNPENLGTALIIDMKNLHLDNGISGVFGSRDYLFSEDPIDIKITLQGIGIDTMSGPIGDVVQISTGDVMRIMIEKENTQNENITTADIKSWFDYTIDGGEIISITPDVELYDTLRIAMTASQNGSLEIRLPREYIDAKAGNQDDSFFVFVDREEVNFEETVTTSTDRTLTIQFPAGAEKIEIIGTFVIPEFGTITIMILALAIISIITVSAKSRLSIMPRY